MIFFPFISQEIHRMDTTEEGEEEEEEMSLQKVVKSRCDDGMAFLTNMRAGLWMMKSLCESRLQISIFTTIIKILSGWLLLPAITIYTIY